MKIVDKFSRNVLGEGRDFGMGFAFAKKRYTTYTAVQAVTCCKDYLNDVVYAEKTKIILPVIYGFKYSKLNDLFTDKFYLIIKILPKHSIDYLDDDLIQDKEWLKTNYKTIEQILNLFEEKLNISKTVITPADDDYFVVQADSFWVSKLYLFGAYTLLLRAFQGFNKEVTTIEDVLNNPSYKHDSFMLQQAKPKLLRILNGELPEQPFVEGAAAAVIHNQSGIISFNF